MPSARDTPVRIMLVDDHDAVRIGWKDLLERSTDFTVVASAESGDEALIAVGQCAPDICLVDLRLPGLAGPALIEALLGSVPGMRVVVLTIYGEKADVAACLAAGASGYLSKDSSPEELMTALKAIMAGKQVLDFGDVLRPVFSAYAAQSRIEAAAAALTPRETEVLRGVAEGLSNSEIGAQLGIAEQTVKNILSTARRKLGAPNRTAAAMVARDEGLL